MRHPSSPLLFRRDEQAGQQQQLRVIGDYVITQQIGAGSFAVVWKGRHKVWELDVAIKEIPTEKLNPKLQESLESEIAILKRADHPNIIRLLEIVRAPGRIFLVLEYCAGGDLSEHIKRQGRVHEAVARHLMSQLGAGLQVLRQNNVIHRDLKPQNILLSTRDANAVLKIADFGFARSLQPQGLAETLCGSPLYMAPEILQFQKYDAKADLWSVGAILYELVTGRPPFGGANHIQLLRNIEQREVRFPESVAAVLSPACINLCRGLLNRRPAERLSFEEFFHHPFLDLKRSKPTLNADSIARSTGMTISGLTSTSGSEVCSPSGVGSVTEGSTDDCFPFVLDDVQQVPRADSPQAGRTLPATTGVVPGRTPVSRSSGVKAASMGRSGSGVVRTASGLDAAAGSGTGSGLDRASRQVGASPSPRLPDEGIGNVQYGTGAGAAVAPEDGDRYKMLVESSSSTLWRGGQRSFSMGHAQEGGASPLSGDPNRGREGGEPEHAKSVSSRCGLLSESMECIEREYVLVDAPSRTPTDTLPRSPRAPIFSIPRSMSLGSTPLQQRPSSKSPSRLGRSPSVPVAAVEDSAEVVEMPSLDPAVRIASLQRGARLVSELAIDKLEGGQALESLSVQLLCLAIWREAVEVCKEAVARSGDGGNTSGQGHGAAVSEQPQPPAGTSASLHMASPGDEFSADVVQDSRQQRPEGRRKEVRAGGRGLAALVPGLVEREYLQAVERAKEVAEHLGDRAHQVLPDAVELVFQAALAVGRGGAVEELMGNLGNAAVAYSKSAALFNLLLVEVPALALLQPPLELTSVDRGRLRRYADSVATRQSHCSEQRLAQRSLSLGHVSGELSRVTLQQP
eukprot:SM000237S08130  [mRNA]  locus=s237:115968:120950:+ [translate_table: standard]